MHVCTCENQELLTIEDRLEGVRRLYCENFAGCVPSKRGEDPPIELALLETSGLVYLRAVSEQLKMHHTLDEIGVPPVGMPMLPAAVALAPKPASRLVVPLVGVLALVFAVAGAFALDLWGRRSGAASESPGRQVSGSLAAVRQPAEAASSGAFLRTSRVLRPAASPPSLTCSPPVGAGPRPVGSCSRAQIQTPPSMRRRAARRSSAMSPAKRLRAPAPPTAPLALAAPPTAPLALAAPPTAPLALVAPPTVASTAPVDLTPVRHGAPPVVRPSLERLLKAATGKTGTVMPPPEVLPHRLGAKAITVVQGQLRHRAASCLRRFGFTHLTLRVRVRVRGDRGRVTWAKVRGRLRGTPAGRCIERAARHLRTPRFVQARQTLTLPIRVH